MTHGARLCRYNTCVCVHRSFVVVVVARGSVSAAAAAADALETTTDAWPKTAPSLHVRSNENNGKKTNIIDLNNVFRL